MKFITAVLTLAAVGVAAFTVVEAQGSPPQGGRCTVNGNDNGKVTCCNSAIPIIGQLLCNVLTIEQSCTAGQTVYCCNTSFNTGLINVNLLNCVRIQ